MSARTTKRVCLTIGALVLLVVLIRLTRRAELDHKFDRTRLLGLSRDEVQRLVGTPDFLVESNVWLYFDGHTPVATLEFREGRVHMVERSPW